MRVRAKSFEGAICDEVQLAVDAKKHLNRYIAKGASMPLVAEDILSISQEYSPDLAARMFYEGLLMSNHKSFIERLQSHSKNSIEPSIKEQSSTIKIILIPGMFYREHPETGADGALIIEIAHKFGFEIERLNIKSSGSVRENSSVIEKKLKAERHPNIWLVSISKGSSDLRHYLQTCEVGSNINGWLNIAGIPKGLPYVDHRLGNPFKRFISRFLSLLFSVNYQSVVELQTHHPFWNNKVWPESLEMIHMVPVPHSSHIQDFLRAKYRKTLNSGPNDGLTPLIDNLDLPGNIYPVWGCDHFMRNSEMSRYIYQLFNYISAPKKEQKDLS